MPAKKPTKNPNVEIYLEDVRCSHPHLFELSYYKDDKRNAGRYTCGFILDKKKHAKLIEEIEDAIEKVKDLKWDGDPPRIKEDNICLIDGDDTDKDELQGCMLLKSASNEKYKPTVLGRDKRKLTKEDGKPYGGCYVNALVSIYAADKHDDQVNCSLEAVQYFRAGPAFGKGPADTSRFEEFEEDDADEEYTSMRDKGGRGRDRDEDDRESRRSSRRDRDEDDDRPSRRSSRRDRDEDDRDSRRSSRRDRDEDDRGSRRSRRDED